MIRSKYNVLAILAGSMLASACAVSQPIPSAGEQTISDITVVQAQQDERLVFLTDAAAGSTDDPVDTVRWGGTIASVLNSADGITVVEIVSRPLYSGGRPIHDDRSDGRFLAEIREFLDPQIVVAGRDMTVVGSLAGRRNGLIGETRHVFPVVAVEEYKYWKEAVVVPANPYPYWWHYPPYGHSDPLWRDWPFNPDKRPRRSRATP